MIALNARKPEPDFSRESIEKKVNEEIVSHSLTLFPAAAGILSILAGALFAIPAALALGALSLAVSAGFFSYQKFGRFGKLTTAYLNQLRHQQKEKLVEKLSTIGGELEKLGCHQGAAQVKHLKTKFEGLAVMIQEKLPGAEEKSSRLNAVAEKLYLATIDNLLQARQILQSVDTIDIAYIDEQLERVSSQQERETLEQRRQMKMDGIEAAEERIAHNEIAMTRVNQLAMELARAKTWNSPHDMEESLHEITNNVRVEEWMTE